MWGSKNPSQCQNDQWRVRAHFRGILLKPGHPDPPRTSFLTELPRFAPLISEWPFKTGLQAPRGHQDRGTSFRQPSGARLGFPRNVSVVTNASRRAFGAFPRKTEITTAPKHLTTIPEHLKTFSEYRKNPDQGPKAFPGQRSLTEDDEPMIPDGAKGSPKRMQRRTKVNQGSRGTKLRSERPNRAKPTLEAPSRPNVRPHDAWRY
ncbi:hypothetical protein CDL15_Pgr023790 [Punica granatum]|uniref:Uncharacterized protein n=1 Tax=Punica granatum TaxID=22663 RepID=A0A218WRX8_PUNGR|nr:hypothetical protein CDL15_Pgr023790 [Punica granatum]